MTAQQLIEHLQKYAKPTDRITFCIDLGNNIIAEGYLNSAIATLGFNGQHVVQLSGLEEIE